MKKMHAGAKTLDEVTKTVSKRVRQVVANRVKILAMEEVSLAQLRKAQKLTQQDVAKVLGLSQATISQVEGSQDLYLSTLRKHVKALGGELILEVKFPQKPPVALLLGHDDKETAAA